MGKTPELPETAPVLASIAAGAPLGILVGYDDEGKLMVLNRAAQDTLRDWLLKITQPTPPEADAATLERKTA